MQRRTFLTTGVSALAMVRSPIAPTLAEPRLARLEVAPSNENFITALVRKHAEELSRHPFVPPTAVLPPGLATIGYDQYRDLRFRPERAVWHKEHLGFELQFFPAAYIYQSPVEIFLVENGGIRPLTADPSMFHFGPLAKAVTSGSRLSFSGFRIHAPINRADYYDELLVFQGASYFRGLGRNHHYGLSARALALNTVGREREEFPLFRSFWIERPEDHRAITIHALLDCPSVTGTYSFLIQPGATTVVDIVAILFPRRSLSNVGIAPLTSMFLRDAHDGDGRRDFRPAVHDSDGLAVWNGRDERLWRPLLNARSVQVSCFRDDNPKGLGLIQRERDFQGYQDLEAHYEQRPSAWIAPKDNWGAGCVELIEIPSQGEYADNIVAYWRPDTPLLAGGAHRFAYHLAWCDDAPMWDGFRVDKTRIGEGSKAGATRFVVDFVRGQRHRAGIEQVASNGAIAADIPAVSVPDVDLTASAGALTKPVVHANPHLPGHRVTFELDPQGQPIVELRLTLHAGGQRISEVWLYRSTM